VPALTVGFGHKARRGKDTAVQAIIEARGDQYVICRYAFADALKREVNAAAEDAGGMLALFTKLATVGAPLPKGGTLLLPEWVKYDPSPDMTDPLCPLGKQRTLLQWWGSDYRRNACDKFYWVKAIKDTVERENPQVVLVPDMRFQNEFLWVKANNGFTVQLERKGFAALSTNPTHHSENELNGAPYDYTIVVPEGDLAILRLDAVGVFDLIVASLSPQFVGFDFANVQPATV